MKSKVKSKQNELNIALNTSINKKFNYEKENRSPLLMNNNISKSKDDKIINSKEKIMIIKQNIQKVFSSELIMYENGKDEIKEISINSTKPNKMVNKPRQNNNTNSSKFSNDYSQWEKGSKG